MPPPHDLAIIGGGINGCGIARDAAGRGLKVFLCEQGDLGGATSWASSKLIHGGLRYLEQYQFKLVRESLRERAILLRTAGNLVTPLRFVLPHSPGMRPKWMIRLGLALYDAFAARDGLPGSAQVNLNADQTGAMLRDEYAAGFAYSDCRADDSRLVIAAAKDAHRRGAVIAPRLRCEAAVRDGDCWRLHLQGTEVRAKALVDATGPWAGRINFGEANNRPALKLVQGSHIVVRKFYAGEHAYILQNPDRRVVFVIPFEGEFALIGTTETDYAGDPGAAQISDGEREYLCASVNRYFRVVLSAGDVLWAFSGVRPLLSNAADARVASRDYALQVDAGPPPRIDVYGGKLTTFRSLAEAAVDKLAAFFPGMGAAWTADSALPGNAMPASEVAAKLAAEYAFLPAGLRTRLAASYGEEALAMLSGVGGWDDMGECIAGDLYAVEAAYLREKEWAGRDEDVLWRRSKAGLRVAA